MSDTALFNKFYKTGFPTDWSADIPNFTSADWRELLVLVLKIDWLSGVQKKDNPSVKNDYDSIHASIIPEFWQNFKSNSKPRNPGLSLELYRAKGLLGVPFGLNKTASGGVTTYEQVLTHFVIETTPEIRREFLAGLREAVIAYDGQNYTTEILTAMFELAKPLNHFDWKDGVNTTPFMSAADLKPIVALINALPVRPGQKASVMSWLKAVQPVGVA